VIRCDADLLTHKTSSLDKCYKEEQLGGSGRAFAIEKPFSSNTDCSGLKSED
jgi:hypothetical protein